MQETPYWIYLDLFYIFTKWDKVLEAASNNESQAVSCPKDWIYYVQILNIIM